MLTPKPPAITPTGVEALMQFVMQSMRDVSGINIEMLGLADRGQAASLGGATARTSGGGCT